jgi:chromosome segregation ATPase
MEYNNLRNANHHHESQKRPGSPKGKAASLKALFENRHGLPVRLTDSLSPVTHSEALPSTPNHTTELLGRIQALERELSRSRTEHENDTNVLVDKYAWLETQFWNLQTETARTAPTVTRLCDICQKNESSLKKIVDVLTKIEIKVNACEKAIAMHNSAIGGIRDQQETVRMVAEKQKEELEDVKGDAERAKLAMGRLASIADILKH